MDWLVNLLKGEAPSNILALLGVAFSVFFILRLVIRYERTFIRDQDEEIESLRKELVFARAENAEIRAQLTQTLNANGQLQNEVLSVRLEIAILKGLHDQCQRDSRAVRDELDALRQEVAVLRVQHGGIV